MANEGGKRVSPHFLNRSNSGGSIFRWRGHVELRTWQASGAQVVVGARGLDSFGALARGFAGAGGEVAEFTDCSIFMHGIKDKVVVITGASSGIGEAFKWGFWD